MANNNQVFIESYEHIHKNLMNTTKAYLDLMSEEDLKKFLKDSAKGNRFAEVPNGNLKEIILDDFQNFDYLEGEIGTLDSEDQSDGITLISLSMLMSNRLSKQYKYLGSKKFPEKLQKIENEIRKIEKNIEIDTNDNPKANKARIARYQEKRNNLMQKQKHYQSQITLCNSLESKYLTEKSTNMEQLIASLYILDKTGEDYANTISYGYSRDNIGDDRFTVDLPYRGQICVHTGHRTTDITENAKQKTLSILDLKLQKGQLTAKEVQNLKNDLNSNCILPDYEGKLFEFNSGIPIETEYKNINTISSHLGLDILEPEDISTNHIESLYNLNLKNGKLTTREIYYFALKQGWPKDKLTEILDVEKSRTAKKQASIKKSGKQFAKSTKPDERQSVKAHENKMRQNQKDKIGEK